MTEEAHGAGYPTADDAVAALVYFRILRTHPLKRTVRPGDSHRVPVTPHLIWSLVELVKAYYEQGKRDAIAEAAPGVGTSSAGL